MKLPSPPPVFLDHHATTPIDPRVGALVLEVITTSFGNANSVEKLNGEVAADLVAAARSDLAYLLEQKPDGVNFTSGATDSIVLAALARAIP